MQDRSSSVEALWRTAQALNRLAAPAKPLPPLFFVTDPARTPDPVAIAETLPRGCGVIYRHFGAADALLVARRLRETADIGRLVLLIGRDAGLAKACGADGVHLPEADLEMTPALRGEHPHWLLTGAAHDARALVRARSAGLDAVLVSPVFASRSPSAGAPLGVDAFSSLVRGAGLPVYALGGVTAETAAKLTRTGATGLAAVEAFETA